MDHSAPNPGHAPSRFYPAELQYIKALFVQEQFRQCIGACRELLAIVQDEHRTRPLQDTFVLFYMALSHDELARVMHPDSRAKLPSFRAAESFYLEALESLPSFDEARASFADATTLGHEFGAIDFVSESDLGPRSQREASDSTLRSPAVSSSPFISTEDKIERSIRDRCLRRSGAENDDSESHHSFDQIRTPNQLRRDFSRMSLLDPTPPKRKSMTHGLLKPIRLGSPPKQFHVPPPLPYSGQYRPHLPKLNTKPPSRTPTIDITSARSSQFSSPELGEPVSPLGPDEIASDTSTISPVSPTTPMIPSPILHPSNAADHVSDIEDDTDVVDDTENHSEGAYEDVVEHHDEAQSEVSFEYGFEHGGHFADGVENMRTQLERQVDLVREARDRFQQTQSSKRSAKLFASAVLSGVPRASTGPGAGGSLARSESHRKSNYGAFVPADIKAIDRQERIQAGRARKWERKRFEPARYQELCELALAEL